MPGTPVGCSSTPFPFDWSSGGFHGPQRESRTDRLVFSPTLPLAIPCGYLPEVADRLQACDRTYTGATPSVHIEPPMKADALWASAQPAEALPSPSNAFFHRLQLFISRIVEVHSAFGCMVCGQDGQLSYATRISQEESDRIARPLLCPIDFQLCLTASNPMMLASIAPCPCSISLSILDAMHGKTAMGLSPAVDNMS